MNNSIPKFSSASSNNAMDLKSVSPSDSPESQHSSAGQSGLDDLSFAMAHARLQLQQRIAVNQLTTLPWCLTQDLEEFQQAGVAAIGLNWRKLSEYGLRRSLRKILQSQLPVSSLGSIGGFTGENGYSTREVMSDARRMIRLAGQMRASTVTVVTGPLAGHIRSHASRLVVESLQELLPMATLYGVQLALQPMHPLFGQTWSFLHSLDDTLAILDRVGDPRLKIAMGTYHLWQEPRWLDRLAEIAPRIGLVSLADWGDAPRHNHDRLLPGEGRLPLLEVIRTLEGRHYSGWYELEVWSRDLWKQDRRDLMRACVLSRDYLSSSLAHV